MSLPKEINDVLTELHDFYGIPQKRRLEKYEQLIKWFEAQEAIRRVIADEFHRLFPAERPEIQRFIVTKLAKFHEEACLEPLMKQAQFSRYTYETAKYWQRIHQEPKSPLNDLRLFLGDDAALRRSESQKTLLSLLKQLPRNEIENAVTVLSQAAEEYPQLLFCAAQLPLDTGYREPIKSKLGVLNPERLAEYLFECWQGRSFITLENAIELLLPQENPDNVWGIFVKASGNGRHYDLLTAVAEILSNIPNYEMLLSFIAFVAGRHIPLSKKLLQLAFYSVKNLLKPLAEETIGDKWQYSRRQTFTVLRQAPKIFQKQQSYISHILDELQAPLSALASENWQAARQDIRVKNMLFTGSQGKKSRKGLVNLLAWEMFSDSEGMLSRLFRRSEYSEHKELRKCLLDAIKQANKFGVSQDCQSSIESVFNLFFSGKEKMSEPEQELENIKALLEQALSFPSIFQGMVEYEKVLRATLRLLDEADREFGLYSYRTALETVGDVSEGDFASFRTVVASLYSVLHQDDLERAIAHFKDIKPLHPGIFSRTLLPIIDLYLNAPIKKREPIPWRCYPGEKALQLAKVFSPQEEGRYGIGLQRLTHYKLEYFEDVLTYCDNAVSDLLQLYESGLESEEYSKLIEKYIDDCMDYYKNGGKGRFPDQVHFKDLFRIPLEVLFTHPTPGSRNMYKYFSKELYPAAQSMLRSYLEENYHRHSEYIQTFMEYVQSLPTNHPCHTHQAVVLNSLTSPQDKLTPFLSSYLDADDKHALGSQINQLYEAILSLHNYALFEQNIKEFDCPRQDLDAILKKLPRSIYYECSLWRRAFQAMIKGAGEHGRADKIAVRLNVIKSPNEELQLVINIGDNGRGWIDDQGRKKELQAVFESPGQEIKEICTCFNKYCSNFIVEECHFTDENESHYEINRYDILANVPNDPYQDSVDNPNRRSFDPLFEGNNQVNSGTIYTLEIPVWTLKGT